MLRKILSLTFLLGIICVSAQEKLKFHIVDFDVDPFDLSAKDPQYEKIDGNGDRFAIIKVTSNNPNDKLNEYTFNFGNMKHVVEDHDGVLWLYVQRNAKLVTITRNGYIPINKYDLHTTIESGKNYVMSLSSEGKKVYTQMVQFNIQPADSKATVMVKNVREGSQEELFGYESDGSIAKNLEYGTYTYKVLTDNYHMAEGRFTLNNKKETFIENVDLRPNFSEMTFNVDADADIYIDGIKRGTRQWTGILKAGLHQVECHQPNYKSTSQSINVGENDTRTINLHTPEPILGTVAIVSTPLGAEIYIDGKHYGKTPKNIDILIGDHTIELSKTSYRTETQSFNVREDRTVEVNMELGKTSKTVIESDPNGAMVYIDNEYHGNTPYTFEGDIGEHKIKLCHIGYKSLEKTVFLGGSDHERFSLKRERNYNNGSFVKKSDLYIETGIGIGPFGEYSGDSDVEPIHIPIVIGAHLKKFNLEFNFCWLELIDKYDSYSSYYFSPQYSLGLKLGYGFNIGKRFKITPQIGFRYVECYDDYYCNLTAGIRAFYAFSRRVGISYTPEYITIDGFNQRFAFVITF